MISSDIGGLNLEGISTSPLPMCCLGTAEGKGLTISQSGWDEGIDMSSPSSMNPKSNEASWVT